MSQQPRKFEGDEYIDTGLGVYIVAGPNVLFGISRDQLIELANSDEMTRTALLAKWETKARRDTAMRASNPNIEPGTTPPRFSDTGSPEEQS